MKNQSFRKETNQIAQDIKDLVESFQHQDSIIYFDKFFSDLKKVFDFEHATVFFIDKESYTPIKLASTSRIINLINPKNIKRDCQRGYWDDEKNKLIVYHAPPISKFRYLNNKFTDYTINSYLSLVLSLNCGNCGVINFAHSRKQAFTPQEVNHLQMIVPFIETIISKNVHIKQMEEQRLTIIDLQKRLLDVQEDLVEAEMKIAVSATIASLNHEINNPLMVISGYIQLLQSQLLDDESSQEKLMIVNSQITRIVEILSKLRELENPLFEKYINDNNIHNILKLSKE